MMAMLLFMVIFILICVAVPFIRFEEQISTLAVQVMIERMAETFAKIVVPIFYVILHEIEVLLGNQCFKKLYIEYTEQKYTRI